MKSMKYFKDLFYCFSDLPRSKKRLVELMYNTAVDAENKKNDKIFEVKFFRSPKKIICEEEKPKKMLLQVNKVKVHNFIYYLNISIVPILCIRRQSII